MRLRRMWQVLERVPGLSELACVWKELAQHEYDQLNTFLRPTQKLSDTYPCPSMGGNECPRKVITHGENDIVAVCGNSPPECDPVRLQRSDLVIYEFDINKCLSAIATEMGLRPEISKVDGGNSTWCIGKHYPLAGYSFKVFVVIPEDRLDVEKSLSIIAAQESKPFILYVSTKDVFCDSLKIVEKFKVGVLYLEDIFAWDTLKGLSAMGTPDDILRTFNSNVLPSPDDCASTMVHFNTPPDAKWEDLQITFLDGHTVSVRVKDVAGTFNYTQMGMSDRRTTKPTKQWELLRCFANEPGKIMDWNSQKADRKNQKRREKLAGDLRRFFRIDGDPIKLTEDKSGWEPRFVLIPD